MADQDRLPPQDLDAEQAVLGCCLLEKHAMERVVGHVVADDFYRESHRTIYQVVYELYTEDAPVDLITVSTGLRRQGKLEAIGGGEYLTALIGQVPTAAHVDRYVKTLKNCAALREGILVGAELQALCYAFPADPSQAIADTVTRLEDLQAMCHPNGMPRPLSEVADEHERRINRRRSRPYEIGTAQFGIPELDKITGGVEDFGYTCLMALTGMGKTGLAIQCAVSSAWAIQSEITATLAAERSATETGSKQAMATAAKAVSAAQKKTVIVFALEEAGWQWHLRMAGFCGRFDTRDARSSEAWGRVLDGDPGLETRYQSALQEVRSLPIVLNDEPQTVESILSHCRRVARDQTPILIIVDYMQQVGKQIGKAEREEQEFRDMANKFRRLADKLDCPVFGLSQITEQGTGKGRTQAAAGAKALQNSADMNLIVAREQDSQTDEVSDMATIRCRKAKLAPYFRPFKCHADPKTGRWCAASDKPGDPQQDEKKQRDRKDN